MNQPSELQPEARCFKPYIEHHGDTVLCRGPVDHPGDCDTHWPVVANVPVHPVIVRDVRLCIQVNVRATTDPRHDNLDEFRTGWGSCVRDDPDHRRLRHGGMPFMRPTAEVLEVRVPVPGE